MNDNYLQKAIEITLQNALIQESAEQEQLAIDNELKRDAMREKVAKLGSRMISGKGNFAEKLTFEDICRQNNFDPEEIINKSYQEQLDSYGDFGAERYLGGL